MLLPEFLDLGWRGDVHVGFVADFDAVHRINRCERRGQRRFTSACGSVGAVED